MLIDSAREFNFGKDVLAIAIETLISDTVFPIIIFYTIQKVNEAHPALNGFLIGVMEKIAQRKLWTEIEEDDTVNQQYKEIIWHKFENCSKALGSNIHTVSLITNFLMSSISGLSQAFYIVMNLPFCDRDRSSFLRVGLYLKQAS